MLNEFFDKIYCINLDKRTDRWDRCQNIFESNNLEVGRFSAINGDEIDMSQEVLLPGEVGILLSNLEIVKDAKENNYKNILILEDDVEFIDNINDVFNEIKPQIPDNWGFLYLGGNHIGGFSMINNNIATIKNSYAIHAVGINEKVYDDIINLLPNKHRQVDVYYADLQKKYPSYVIRPHLAWQRRDFSDIQKGVVDYKFLRR